MRATRLFRAGIAYPQDDWGLYFTTDGTVTGRSGQVLSGDLVGYDVRTEHGALCAYAEAPMHGHIETGDIVTLRLYHPDSGAVARIQSVRSP